MSLRKPIPAEMRKILNADDFMRSCKIGGDCEGRIEFNHAMTYKGSRVNELYFIVPVCTKHHRQIAKYQSIMRECMVARIRHFCAEQEVREKYPRNEIVKML